ncbi:outer membrane protein [Bradyrhizobium sp. STM 3557]|uniref:outer membrane protein n=1 Tax=Bradyrhizobium sp. STM 3557 TaxID=578920 RepID=UPI00388D8663
MGRRLFLAATVCSVGLICGKAAVAAEADTTGVLEKLAALEARIATLESENRDYRRRLAHVQPRGAFTPAVAKSSGANALPVNAPAAGETNVLAPAGDLAPVRMSTKAPAIALPVGRWTGFYIGGNIGYGWGSYGASNATGTIVTANGSSAPYGFNAVSGNGNGVTAGIQAGYNWQIAQTVLGIEADWQYLDSKTSTGNSAIAVPTFIGGNFSGSASISTDWYATFRGRVGYAFGPALLYTTGGVALAETKLSANATGSIVTSIFPPTLGPLGSMSASESAVLVGYVVGGGLEYALGTGWSIKGEYLHMGFGTNAYNLTGSLQSPAGLTGVIATRVDIKPSFDIARVGVNYGF